MSMSPSPPTWSRDTKFIVTVIALLTIAGLVYVARSVIPLLALAAVLAYIFQPIVGWLERHRVKRGLAAALCVVLLVILVALGPALLIPPIVAGVRAILAVLDKLPEIFQQWLDAFALRTPTISLLGQTFDVASSLAEAETAVTDAISQVQMPSMSQLVDYVVQGLRTAGGIFRTAADIASGVATVVFSALLLLVYTFFLTKDGSQVGGWLDKQLLAQYRAEMKTLGQQLNLVWKSFFRGQLLLSLTIGVVTFIATALLGLPGPLVLGILAGVLEVIPNLGPVLAMVPAVLLALIQDSSTLPVENNLIFALIVILVYVLIQQIENNVLVPRIMGASLNLHPLIVLVGVVVGASFAGILGAFLAGPVLASLKIMGAYAHAKIVDRDPFAQPAVPVLELKPGQSGASRLARLFRRNKPPIPQPSQDMVTASDVAPMAVEGPDTEQT